MQMQAITRVRHTLDDINSRIDVPLTLAILLLLLLLCFVLLLLLLLLVLLLQLLLRPPFTPADVIVDMTVVAMADVVNAPATAKEDVPVATFAAANVLAAVLLATAAIIVGAIVTPLYTVGASSITTIGGHDIENNVSSSSAESLRFNLLRLFTIKRFVEIFFDIIRIGI